MLGVKDSWAAGAEAPDAAECGARWYAVQCQPHRERIAVSHLANQDFEVFLPWRRKTRRHARKLETISVPFFPGYLFVRLDPTRNRWRSVNGTFGVVRLVCLGDKPSPAPVGVVEALKACCNDDGSLAWLADLVPGQKVRVIAGPFAELIGELESMSDSGRVRVLLEIMGGRTPVFLPHGSIAPAASVL